MGNTQTATGSSTLKKHIETASKTGVLQYDNKKLKEVRKCQLKPDVSHCWSFIRLVLGFVFLTYAHYP